MLQANDRIHVWQLFAEQANGLLSQISTEAVKGEVLLPWSLAIAEPGKQDLSLRGP